MRVVFSSFKFSNLADLSDENTDRSMWCHAVVGISLVKDLVYKQHSKCHSSVYVVGLVQAQSMFPHRVEKDTESIIKPSQPITKASILREYPKWEDVL